MQARFNLFQTLTFQAWLGSRRRCQPGLLSPVALAQQARTANAGVYTEAQASRGRVLYRQQCALCHGERWAAGLARRCRGAFSRRHGERSHYGNWHARSGARCRKTIRGSSRLRRRPTS